ncbi:unnamed protein product [Cuscuta europaea]|uniref:Uncharacterized protein n=1 Tax=Cuscuta europaea TaxID=41803 RepID=A0A9P0YXW7_CUSEU|nr:unnamed protein product [Cuscuta europaea]
MRISEKLRQMQRAWHGHMHTLCTYFEKVGGPSNLTSAKKDPYEGVSKQDWEYLCESWSDPSYMNKTLKNADLAKRENGILEMVLKAQHVIISVVELSWMLCWRYRDMASPSLAFRTWVGIP